MRVVMATSLLLGPWRQSGFVPRSHARAGQIWALGGSKLSLHVGEALGSVQVVLASGEFLFSRAQ